MFEIEVKHHGYEQCQFDDILLLLATTTWWRCPMYVQRILWLPAAS